jgi:hypothetical protein
VLRGFIINFMSSIELQANDMPLYQLRSIKFIWTKNNRTGIT